MKLPKDLEMYTPQGPRRTQALTVSIRKGKQFSFKRASWEAIGSPDQALLYFSPSERLVVVRPASDRSLGAVNASPNHDGRYYRINCAGFFDRHAIPDSPPRRYRIQAEADEDGPMLVIDLKADPDWKHG